MNDDEAAEAFKRIHERHEAAIDAAQRELYGSFSDWVPQPTRDRVRQAVDTMLGAEQEPAAIGRQVKDYLRDPQNLFFPGTVMESAAYAQAVSYLAHVLEAISKGPVNGLKILGGADAVRGRKIIQGARAGAIAKHGTPEEQLERHAGYQRRVDELHSSNPRLSHWRICQILEHEFVVDSKTIQRYTTIR